MVKVPPDHPPGADAVSSPYVRLNTRSMHTPLVWARLCMTSDAAWDTKAYFGSGRAPACDPMSNSQYEPDLHAIARLCDMHNIPIATNSATAEMLILGLDRGDLDWRNIVNPKNSSRK